MSDDRKIQGGDLFIVDNSDTDWKVKRYLQDWADIAHTFDIAAGYFEIGALLALDGQCQKLEKLGILMGGEVSIRARKALDAYIEAMKEIAGDAEESPEILHTPHNTTVRRLDDVRAARQLDLRWRMDTEEPKSIDDRHYPLC